jgi:hypothetical protein
MIYVFLLGVVAFFGTFFSATVYFLNLEAQNQAPALDPSIH